MLLFFSKRVYKRLQRALQLYGLAKQEKAALQPCKHDMPATPLTVFLMLYKTLESY